MEQMQPIEPASSEPLSKRVVRGGMWVFALRITNRGLMFIRTIILARLLAPEDFGLLGIAMLSISALETFSQTGFQAALIQKKEGIKHYLDTAWTVSAIRGIVLFLILFFSAPAIAGFFNSPQATLVIRVIAVSTLLSGLRNIGIIFFQKELEFDKQFVYEFSATLVDLTVAVTLALILRNVWSLVLGGLAANFIRLFMSYVLHSYHPRIRFDKQKFCDLFGFGKWLLGSSILLFLITQGDDIVVGKMLGVTALGLYQMAYLISNLPATEITHVISQVTFPAYSKLQDHIPKVREAYLKTLQLTAFISMPLAGGIFILAPDFTRIFLGEKWMPMVPAMKILAICGMIRSIGATAGPIFQALGKPNMLAKLTFIKLLGLSLFIYPLTQKYGFVGTSLSVLVATLVSNPIADYNVIKITKCRPWQFLRPILLPFVSVVIMCLVLLLIQSCFPVRSMTGFVVIVVCWTLTFLMISFIINSLFGYKIKKTLMLIYDSIK